MKKSTGITLSKILWLTAFQLIVFSAIGQKDTLVVRNNDSLVCVQKSVAIAITKDLLKKDILELEVGYLRKDIALHEAVIRSYRSDSVLFSTKQRAYEDAVAQYRISLANCESYAKKKDKELAKFKFRSAASQAFLIILSIFVVTRL